MQKSQSRPTRALSHQTIIQRIPVDGSLPPIPTDLLAISTQASTEALHLTHIDGFQFDLPSGVKLYFYLFIDDYTDFRMAYYVSSRSEFLSTLQVYQAFCFFYHKKNLKTLRMDNGSEMSSEEVYQFARFNGIHIQRCAPYRHSQNGKAERGVRTAQEAALTMLHHANLSIPLFCRYAVVNAVQIRNKCITRSSRDKLSTPHELFTGVRPHIEDIHPTGQICYAYVKKDQRKLKYDPKAKKCIFLCEDYERRAYLVMDIDRRTIIASRDVRFGRLGGKLIFPSHESPLKNLAENRAIERTIGGGNLNSSAQVPSQLSPSPSAPTTITTEGMSIHELASLLARNSATMETHDPSLPPTPEILVQNEALSPVEDLHLTEDHVEQESATRPQSPPHRLETTNGECLHENECTLSPLEENRSSRKRNPRYFNPDFVNAVSIPKTPLSYEQALKSDQKLNWKTAMDKELDSLKRQGTWKFVPRAKDMFIVKCKWVYKIKLDEHGKISRYKARLVAKGFTQTPDVDYSDTYSPVLQASTRRLIFSITGDNAVTSIQADVETAFLLSVLDKLIHLEVPKGLSDIPDGHVLLLLKAIYGLKQASLLWYMTASSFFFSLGFKRCTSDPCLLVLTNSLGFLIVTIYVDDLILTSKSKPLIDWVLQKAKARFPIRDVKPLSFTVGIRVIDDRESRERCVRISQTAYIQQLLERFSIDPRKRSNIPMTTSIDCSKENSSDSSKILKSYQQLIGALNYLAGASRPDISYAVNKLSSYLKSPKNVHLESAKRILYYLNATSELAIRFENSRTNKLVAYSDASLSGLHTEDGRSTSGYCIYFNDNLVHWKSKRQTIVCLSTMESELEAISSTVVCLQHVRNVLMELGYTVERYWVRTDSQAAISYVSTSPVVLKPRSRHLALRFHFLRTQVAEGLLILEYVPTSLQVADLFTKPLPRVPFEILRKKVLS